MSALLDGIRRDDSNCSQGCQFRYGFASIEERRINMTEPTEICSVDLGNACLDDEYTLYEDGRVKRYYDRNGWSLNNEDWLEAKTLN